MRWFLLGVVCTCLAALLGGYIFMRQARGFSALEQPSGIERWVARQARSLAIPAQAKSKTNPVPNSAEVLDEARAHWADHCFPCHANDGSGDTVIGKHLYPPSPDMRMPDTQNLSDGELFYIIQNGIRLTGMPGWATGASSEAKAHDEEDSWKLVHFIRHLPQLTVEEKKAMEKLNPKSPDDLREEEEEEKFLRGEDSHEATPEHHHH